MTSTLHGTQTQWELDCRCHMCKKAHTNYMRVQRSKGNYLDNPRGRPRVKTPTQREVSKGRGERFQCMTKNEFMLARGYTHKTLTNEEEK